MKVSVKWSKSFKNSIDLNSMHIVMFRLRWIYNHNWNHIFFFSFIIIVIYGEADVRSLNTEYWLTGLRNIVNIIDYADTMLAATSVYITEMFYRFSLIKLHQYFLIYQNDLFKIWNEYQLIRKPNF